MAGDRLSGGGTRHDSGRDGEGGGDGGELLHSPYVGAPGGYLREATSIWTLGSTSER
jgi:hypothetical protein